MQYDTWMAKYGPPRMDNSAVKPQTLRQWAISVGISPPTAYDRYRAGTLPVTVFPIGKLLIVGESVAEIKQRKLSFKRQQKRISEQERRTPEMLIAQTITSKGISVEEYTAMLTLQNGRCANHGCRTDSPGGPGRWCIDHDHSCCPGKKSCGKCVRGLLCQGCNVGLGGFRDSAEAITGALAYLAAFDVVH